MNLLFILIPIIYLALVLFCFAYTFKAWGKRHPTSINLMHSIFLLLLVPFEKIYIRNIRRKYANKTPGVIQKLNDTDIKYHISWGTLLFAYRNNNFADDDIDLTMFREDYSENVVKEMGQIGFKLSEQWSVEGEIAEQTYVDYKNKLSLDIFIYDKDNVDGKAFDEKNNRYSYKEPFMYDVTKQRLANCDVYAPENIEDYLAWSYGEWEKPDKNYHWFYGDSKSETLIKYDAKIDYKKFD